LLSGWLPNALPAAPTTAETDAALDLLVGVSLRRHVLAALDRADTLAGKIGGCARDAYTVLYVCASLAVLFAASGVAVAGHGPIIDFLVLAELGTLVILFMIFRNAHRVNWHSRWLKLRFHAEYLRCLPLQVALHLDTSAPRHAPPPKAGEHAVDLEADAPHLQALRDQHEAAIDDRLNAHEEQQHGVRSDLYTQLHAKFLEAPLTYVGHCLSYSRMLAQQQLHYHCLRAQQEKTIVHRLHKVSVGAFALTILAVVIHFWWHAPVLTIIGTSVPAFAASVHGFLAQEESERLAARYHQMAIRIHHWLGRKIETPDNLPEAQSYLAELADLMMSEMHDWHRLFGDKGLYHLG
jgi:hypothetical protein